MRPEQAVVVSSARRRRQFLNFSFFIKMAHTTSDLK
jgi:hypothetical protein